MAESGMARSGDGGGSDECANQSEKNKKEAIAESERRAEIQGG